MVWRIPTPVDAEHRLKIDGGKPLFAWLGFWLIPADQAEPTTLTYSWIDPADERWNDAVQEGLHAFVHNRQNAGRPVGFTKIDMKRVISHSIDTTSDAVAYNMTRAIETAFRNQEVEG